MGSAEYVGVGLYSLSEAAHILGVRAPTLRRWVSQYTYRVKGIQYFHRPIVTRSFLGPSKPLTFLELIELLFVKMFREQGVSMQTIRKAAGIAADLFQTPYPFAVKRFDTDGRHIFATLWERVEERRIIEELDRGQTVFDSVVRPFFRKIEYEGIAEARKFWPLGTEGRIVLDPQRDFGKPIDSETGVPTTTLYQAALAEGLESLDVVAHWFEVPLSAVKAAVRYEELLRPA
jgi:uncharacterized protein (DUF433 family)/DNA-binding transcriptional MerR regulator